MGDEEEISSGYAAIHSRVAAAIHVLCIVHVFNAGRSKIQVVAGPKSRCFGPDPALDFSRNGPRTYLEYRRYM